MRNDGHPRGKRDSDVILQTAKGPSLLLSARLWKKRPRKVLPQPLTVDFDPIQRVFALKKGRKHSTKEHTQRAFRPRVGPSDLRAAVQISEAFGL